MKRPITNLTAYLFGNLLVLCVILLGLWGWQPFSDTSIKLPNLLLILVILNTILIFREGFPSRPRPNRGKAFTLENLRKILANRAEPDADLIPEALNALLTQAGHTGMTLYMAEEGGSFTLQNSAGILPRQLSGIRMNLRSGDLVIRHPGNLGDEVLHGWETAWSHRFFRSEVTHLELILLPLNLLGKRKALLAIVPGRSKARKADAAIELAALFLEGVIGVHLTQALSGSGRFIDARTGLLRYDSFKESFEIEIERSERYNQNLTLLLLSLTPFDEISEAARDGLTKALVGSLRASLRRLDQMFSGKVPGEFAALLTETNLEIAQLVAGRIQAAFRKQVQGKDALKGTNIRLYLGTSTYPSDATHAPGILERAEEALATARSRDVPVLAYSALLEEPGRIEHPSEK